MNARMLTLIVFALGPLVARAGATGSQATANAREAEQIVHAFERRRQEGPPLTLRQALDEALQRHPELVALRRQVEAAHQRPAQERALASPTLEAQIWAWPIDTLNPAKAQMYMVTVGQDIPGAGKRRLRAALAEKDIELAETETAARAREIAGEVKRSYAELFLVRHAIDLHLAGLDLLRQLADLSSARYAAGSASQQDVLQAVVEISRLHGDLVTLDEREQLAAARLNLLRDRPPEAPIGPLEAPRERTALPAPDTLQRLALERQPRVRAARLAVERAEAALALTRRERRPDFLVRGGYMLMPGLTDAWTLAAGLTWPAAPWSRGRLDARIAEAQAELEAARARLRAAENTARLAVQEAYVRAEAARQRAALLRTSVIPQSTQALEIARVAYQADRADFAALVDRQRALLDARLEYWRALSELEGALADLEQAVGVPVDTEGVKETEDPAGPDNTAAMKSTESARPAKETQTGSRDESAEAAKAVDGASAGRVAQEARHR